MKKVTFTFCLAAMVFLLTSGTFSTKTNAEFHPPMLLTGTPELPGEPLDYSVIFPQKIVDKINEWSFAEPFEANTLDDNIDNDVATLGRVLFYDNRLSANNTTSCGSCHIQEFAFADGNQFSEGFDGILTTRNSPNLNDLEWQQMGFGAFIIGPPIGGDPFLTPKSYFWDSRETVLEEMVLEPIIHEEELGKELENLIFKLEDTEFYPDLFEKAFGDTEITSERIAEGLSHFLRSMVSFESKFDQMLQEEATFTPAEMAGMATFEESCMEVCHSMPHFGINIPMNNGLDLEYEDGGAGELNGEPLLEGSFKSPSLRNIAVTGPFMHDGRFETLEEVVDFYSDDVQLHDNSTFRIYKGDDFAGFNFTQEEKDNLVAFLHTLTDESFLTDEKFSDPFPTTTGIYSTPELEENIVASPNPLDDVTMIEIDNPNNFDYELTLTNLDGKILRTDKTTSNRYELNMSDLSNGVYILEVNRNGRSKMLRLVVN